MAEVPLVDLEVIVRYSLAIRQEVAPAEEVLAALDESRALVLSLLEGSGNGDGDDHPDQTDQTDQTDPTDPTGQPDSPALEQDEPADGDGEPADEGDGGDPAEAVASAEDEVALDDLAESGSDVDGTPGLDPGPAASRRAPVAAAGAGRRDEVFGPDDDEVDQAWVDEVERIRQRRNRKARQEAEERQARQAQLAAEARRAKRAEEARREEAARQAEEAREEEEARRVQQARRAERGLRAGKPRHGAPGRAQEARPSRARAADDLEDVLELPPPLNADEAARRRAERRRRQSQG